MFSKIKSKDKATKLKERLNKKEIIVTFFGAFFQNLRSSLQKKLNKDLSLIASKLFLMVIQDMEIL